MSAPEVKEVKHKDGTLACKCWEIDGMKLPLSIQNPVQRLKEIRELEYKEGDMFIVTYPKVGTNWLRDSLNMLLKGKPEVVFGGALLEFFPSLDEYRTQEKIRLAVTHLRPSWLSESQKAKAKFILGIRNPKDAAVSWFYHLRKDLGVLLNATWDQFFELVLVENQVIYGGFFDYFREWQKFVESHLDQVLIVNYEDMHKDYQKELRRISDFLDLTVTDEVIKEIAEKGRLKSVREEMMNNPIVLDFAKSIFSDGSLLFYRKGIVGDWKNHFTVAQDEIYDKIIEKEMRGLMFKFDYVL